MATATNSDPPPPFSSSSFIPQPTTAIPNTSASDPPPPFSSSMAQPFFSIPNSSIPLSNPLSTTTVPPAGTPIQSFSDSITPINIPISIKLNQENYLTWQAQVLPLIHGFNFTRFLNSPLPNPTRQASDGTIEFNPDYLTWHRQDQLLLGWLRASLTEAIQAQVVSHSTSASLWSALHQQFSTTSHAKIFELKRQLQSVQKTSSSCSDFLAQIRKLADELTFIGSPPSNDELVLALLNGLGSDYNAFVAAVTATSRRDALSFTDLHGLLLSHEALLKGQMVAQTTLPSAFYAPRAGAGQRWRGSAPRNAHGHAAQRWVNAPAQHINGSSSNSYPSHSSSVNSGFPNHNAGILGPPTGSQVSSDVNQSASQNLQCQICRKFGHVARNCRWRYAPDNSHSRRPPQAYVAQPSSINNSSAWVLDSGASHHVTNDINNLSAFYQYGGSDNLHIGDGTGLPIQNIGTTSLSFPTCCVNLANVLHVDNFSRNLISISKLLFDNPSLTIIFTKSCCIFKDLHTEKVLLEVTSDNGLYYIHASPSHLSSPQALFGIRTSAQLWHDRLGHPSNSTTISVIKGNDLPCTNMKLDCCHDCCLAKSHRLPFSDSLSTSSSPLELIHSDVWGPSPIVSFNGFRYI